MIDIDKTNGPYPARVCGIYFLVNSSGDVVYIGKSKNVWHRIGTHCFSKEKFFNSFYVELCDEHELDDRETRLICEYRPLYNKVKFNNRPRCKKVESVSDEELRIAVSLLPKYGF